jgi:hypothetical protein
MLARALEDGARATAGQKVIHLHKCSNALLWWQRRHTKMLRHRRRQGVRRARNTVSENVHAQTYVSQLLYEGAYEMLSRPPVNIKMI